LKGSRTFQNLSDEYLADWLVTTLFGGYDTSSLALTFILYLLAQHSSYQDTCAQEAQEAQAAVFLDDGTKENVVTDVKEDLPFIFACFWEAIRYYPPTITTARTLHKPLQLEMDGKTIHLPTGTRCFFSLYWIHHSAINFPNPDEYLPGEYSA
jgi:cytochrome P450